jgi:hypothetical protein
MKLSKVSSLALILLLFGLATLVSCRKNNQRTIPESDKESARLFHEKIEDYEKLHRHAARGLPHFKPETSGANILERQHSLATNIQALRAQAKEGDIFTPATAAYFLRQISAAYEENGAAIRATLELGGPVSARRIQINHPYPEHKPYQVMPPTLLAGLPQLPEILEYEIVDRDLLLRDVESNLVIDVARGIIPE